MAAPLMVDGFIGLLVGCAGAMVEEVALGSPFDPVLALVEVALLEMLDHTRMYWISK
jgi:hypothetical protein